MSIKINSAKKLLLTATFLTPLLLAMAGTALAQEAPAPAGTDTTQTTTPDTDDATSTANELNNLSDDDLGDVAGGVPGELPVLAAGEPPADPNAPRGPLTGTYVTRVAHDCFWWNVVTDYYGYSGQSETHEIQLGSDGSCPPPVTQTFPPGVDWIKVGTNGTTYEHHTDGSMIIKNGDGKTIGALAPPMTMSPTKQTSTDAPKGSEVPKNAGTGLKQPANDLPHQTGMTTPHDKQETNAPASAEHARTDSRVTETAVASKTKVAAVTAMKTSSKTMGHVAMASSHMTNFARASGMMAHLGGGMMHLGGMHMGGMRMGGMHMGKR